MIRHPLDSFDLKQIYAVVDIAIERVFALCDRERQIEVCDLAFALQRFQSQVARLHCLSWSVLMDERDLEQGRVAQAPLRLQLFHELLKRNLLMCVRSQ